MSITSLWSKSNSGNRKILKLRYIDKINDNFWTIHNKYALDRLKIKD